MVATETFVIRNRLGLHARVAAKIVGVATQYKAKIFLERDGQEVNAKSILGILTLACPRGSRITVHADGADAEEALRDIGRLIRDKFGED
jgi:phosphocarrier protein HPr